MGNTVLCQRAFRLPELACRMLQIGCMYNAIFPLQFEHFAIDTQIVNTVSGVRFIKLNLMEGILYTVNVIYIVALRVLCQ